METTCSEGAVVGRSMSQWRVKLSIV